MGFREKRYEKINRLMGKYKYIQSESDWYEGILYGLTSVKQKMPYEVYIVTKKLVMSLNSSKYSGHSRISILASCIYLGAKIAELHISQKEIEKMICVSSTSMRKINQMIINDIGEENFQTLNLDKREIPHSLEVG